VFWKYPGQLQELYVQKIIHYVISRLKYYEAIRAFIESAGRDSTKGSMLGSNARGQKRPRRFTTRLRQAQKLAWPILRHYDPALLRRHLRLRSVASSFKLLLPLQRQQDMNTVQSNYYSTKSMSRRHRSAIHSHQ
jgi:hypothetical protein